MITFLLAIVCGIGWFFQIDTVDWAWWWFLITIVFDVFILSS
jgi:hypothetical protein